MLPHLTIGAAIAYLALIAVSLVYTIRGNHIGAASMWGIAGLTAAVALVNELLAAEWISAALWAFSLSLCVFNVRAGQRRAERDRRVQI